MSNISWLECRAELFLLLLVTCGLSIISVTCQGCNTQIGEPLIKISSTPLLYDAAINLTCKAWQTNELAIKYPKTRPHRIYWYDPQDKRVGVTCNVGSPLANVMHCNLVVGVMTKQAVGNYTCKAVNAGYTKCSNAIFEVKIQGKPLIKISSNKLTVGKIVNLTCKAWQNDTLAMKFPKSRPHRVEWLDPQGRRAGNECLAGSLPATNDMSCPLMVGLLTKETLGSYTCKASNDYGTASNKIFEINFQGCGSVINHTLKSPGYPENYPENTDCTSSVLIPQGMKMQISFKDFDLEPSKSCSWDYVKITNEKDQEFGQDKYCGQQTGQTVLVTGKYILIKFHSDHALQKKGFFMYFTVFPLAFTTIGNEGGVYTTQKSYQTSQEIPTSSNIIIYISSGVAFILLLVLCLVLGFWNYRRLLRKKMKRSAGPVREIIPFDKWELLPEQIEHEEELGRGAFGVVYKATLKRRVGIDVFDPKKRLEPKKACQVVAVKVLQGTHTFILLVTNQTKAG
ncbi:hypothetical protein OS493_024595 [Desmophyllum pertusum]|uniref:Uncharacterized protein n=1 Tax=Desmophyllum pertusum TaxID=174260 RepID=A0A9W9ZZE6_9CNID|nr:hypothetical protein OS493_024595 [Desmophyllum pertusum]